MPENDGTSRLDRMVKTLKLLRAGHVQFQRDYNKLLKAQIRLKHSLDRFVDDVNRRRPPELDHD